MKVTRKQIYQKLMNNLDCGGISCSKNPTQEISCPFHDEDNRCRCTYVDKKILMNELTLELKFKLL